AVTARGCRMLDAPVSGGSVGARDATLTIMVGGDAADLEAQRDLLRALGTRVVHCGPIGMGESGKLANNLLDGPSVVAGAEAFALGIRGGADPAVLLEVIQNSSGNCWSLRNTPVPGLVPGAPVNQDFAPGFMVDLMHKDLGLALGAGADLGLPLTLTAGAHQLYGLASRHRDGRPGTAAGGQPPRGPGGPPGGRRGPGDRPGPR